MANQQVETSVFIRTNGDLSYPRESISGRPLLRSSTSTGSTTKSTSSMICNQTLKKYGIFSAILLVFVIAIIVVVVIVTQNSSNDDSSKSASTQFQCRHHLFKEALDTARDKFSHHKCSTGSEIRTVKGCESAQKGYWIIVDRNSSEFEALKESLPSSNKDASSILISPLFRSSKNEDVIHVSLSNPFEQPFEVYLVSSEFQIQVNMTSEPCQYGFISNPAFGSESITYRVVVFSKAILSTSDRLLGSVTSHIRPTFEDIVTYAKEDTSDPKFVTVPIGTRNLCSAEILNEVTECDWKIVLHVDNDRFQLHDHHDCIDQGVSHHKDDGYVWFVALEPSRPTSSAYLISPIIEGGSSHFLLSFWALPRCNDTTLRAYIVPSYQHIQGVKTDLKRLIYEKHYNKSNQDWIFTFESIEIPTTYKTFQILLEGICTNTTCTAEGVERNGKTKDICHHHSCDDGYRSVLGLDDLAVELRYDQCIVNNYSIANLNCSFQEQDGSPTICAWNSTEEFNPFFFLPRGEYDLLHWQPINEISPMDERDHGVNPEHFDGRGHILHFDANGRFTVDNYFRSPLVIGNSNCTCVMSFLYLLRGHFAPRLQVNMVLGANQAEKNRPIIPQWAVSGHQSDDWIETTLLLNVRTEPFQVEIRLLEGTDSRADVEIDDIAFSSCDFRIYEV